MDADERSSSPICGRILTDRSHALVDRSFRCSARTGDAPSTFAHSSHLRPLMRRTFLINLALVLVLNLLVKPFYILGIDAEVQVRVGTSAYGTYYALLSLSFLLNMLLDLG